MTENDRLRSNLEEVAMHMQRGQQQAESSTTPKVNESTGVKSGERRFAKLGSAGLVLLFFRRTGWMVIFLNPRRSKSRTKPAEYRILS